MPFDPTRPPDGALPGFDVFAEMVLADNGFTPARHHRLLMAHLIALAEGEIDRLMVLMPPGSAKSTYCSVLFPVWFLARHHASAIVAAAHTADLANHFARQARALATAREELLGYKLRSGERAAARWSTSARGEYFATGVRGPLVGRRADLAIVDDPVRNLAEAESPRMRDRLWEWYCSDLVSRLKPRGRIMLVMTRWHVDDLAGRLLERNESDWSVLRLPALAEAEDPMGRAEGEALWPEWEDEVALLRKRDQAGERMWQALYQQSPRPATGALFKVAHIGVLDYPPDTGDARLVRGWDLAATPANGSNDPDWTVGVKLMRESTGRYVIMDVVRQRTSPFEVEQTLRAVAVADGRPVMISLPEDPGQAGKAQASAYVRDLAGFAVKTTRETGKKLTRSLPMAAQVEAGNVMIVRGPWNSAFLEELRDFPYGRKDDQVDALNAAFSMMADVVNATHRAMLPIFAR